MINCQCNKTDSSSEIFDSEYLGMDEQEGIFGDVYLRKCTKCGAHWLRYYYATEGISNSGKWWLAKITLEDASIVTAYNAIRIIEKQAFYYVGGSYYDGKVHKTSGRINEATPDQNKVVTTKSSTPNYSDSDEGKNDEEYDDLRDLFYP